jgi:sigma-B regulation protein RsbQ
MTTLVLLPGMDGTGDLFEPFLAELTPRFNTIVIRYPASVALEYEDLIELVRDKLPADDEFVILGESFSGPVAVSLAAQAPPNLRGVILCASFIHSPVTWPALLKAFSHLLPFGAIPAGVLSIPLLGRFGSSGTRRLLADALSTVPTAVLRARIRSVLTVDVRDAAAAVKVPFLYLQASADLIVPKLACMSIRELVPALQVIELSGPHMLLQTSPRATAQAVEAFVDMAMLQKTARVEQAKLCGLLIKGKATDELSTPHIPVGSKLASALVLLESCADDVVLLEGDERGYRATAKQWELIIYCDADEVNAVCYDDESGRRLTESKLAKVHRYLSRYGSLTNWEMRMDNGWMRYWFNPLARVAMVYGIHMDVIRFNKWDGNDGQ